MRLPSLIALQGSSLRHNWIDLTCGLRSAGNCRRTSGGPAIASHAHPDTPNTSTGSELTIISSAADIPRFCGATPVTYRILPDEMSVRNGPAHFSMFVTMLRPSVLSLAVAFEDFAATVGLHLRVALVAAYGPEVGLDAAAEAIAYGWQHWERVGVMSNPAGYLYRVGQSAARREFRRRDVHVAREQDPMLQSRRADDRPSRSVTPASVESSEAATSTVQTSTSEALEPASTTPTSEIFRPMVDPNLCTPLAATGGTGTGSTFDLHLFAWPTTASSFPIQIIGDPATGPTGPFALLQRYPDQEHLGDPSTIKINDWNVALSVAATRPRWRTSSTPTPTPGRTCSTTQPRESSLAAESR
jgi:DNA-directed RNA polymerase specialized sigma24 family protein